MPNRRCWHATTLAVRYTVSTTGGTEQKAAAEERFFAALEKEVGWCRCYKRHKTRILLQVAKVSNFTGTHVTQVQKALLSLKEKVKADKDRKKMDDFLAEAGKIGDDFLELEKFVNLNYMVRFTRYTVFLGPSCCPQYLLHVGNYSCVLATTLAQTMSVLCVLSPADFG